MSQVSKKIGVLFSTFVLCTAMSVCAQQVSVIIPVGCPCDKSCEKPIEECPQCNPTPVFDTCDELQNWKTKYCEKRVKLYDYLCLTQEQRVKAKILDDKFFDVIAPLKLCCMQEKKKLEEMECNKNCSRKAKNDQKQKIKDLKAEIKDKKKQHSECFTKLLNCEQREKYKEFKKDKCKKNKKAKCECGCK